MTDIVFTAHGSNRCALVGFPSRVTLFDAAGRVVTEYQVTFRVDYPPGPNGGVPLVPGLSDGAPKSDAVPGQATLSVTTDSFLCGHVVVSSMALHLSDGGTFTLPIGFGPDPNGDCFGEAVHVSAFEPVLIPTPAVVSPPDLTVSYNLPARMQAGAVLHYTVTLTNVSGHPIEFQPCPAYTEFLKGFFVRERHLLNCAVVPRMAAGESRTFAMQFAVPPGPPPMPQDILSWWLDPPLQSQNSPGPADIRIG